MERIFARKILPAAVIPNAAAAVPMARALLAGGLDIMEVTFRNADAPRCVELIRKEVPEMQIGAGTLLTVDQIKQAVNAGAQFGVTPGFNPTVIDAARSMKFSLIPGVMTPGEMERALEMGCPLVKFFPAQVAGGVEFLKAISGPYAHTALRIIPLGGIGPSNIKPYLALPIVAAIGGSWMASRELAAAQDWPRITALAQEAVALTRS